MGEIFASINRSDVTALGRLTLRLMGRVHPLSPRPSSNGFRGIVWREAVELKKFYFYGLAE